MKFVKRSRRNVSPSSTVLGWCDSRSAYGYISMSSNGNRTLGWYSKKIYQKDINKFVIGFIEKMNTVSRAVLIKYLATVCKMASSKANDNIAFFKKQLFLEFENYA